MFESFLNEKIWPDSHGGTGVVISSRLRLARNLEDFPFPSKADSFQQKKILEGIKSVYSEIGPLRGSVFVDMSDVDSIDKYILLERHLISQEHLKGEHKAVIISKDEVISIMINEEDHLRIQVIKGGFNFDEAYRIINKVDDDFSRHYRLAFSEDLGYLTSCPTNTGTGLRISSMLHLPGLILTKRINKVLELLAKLSHTARGLFGEGTQAMGNFFQISNQVSLGFKEDELKDNLINIIRQIEDQELSARDFLLKKHKHSLEDNIWRSWGMLTHCRLINSGEAFSHLSMLRLGVDLGIINSTTREEIKDLFVIIQPGHLQKAEGKILNEKERDFVRAEILRKRLGG